MSINLFLTNTVIIQLLSSIDADYSLYDPNQDLIRKQEKSQLFKESFTTLNGGYYSACVKNKNLKKKKGKKTGNQDKQEVNDEMSVNFLIKHGIAAKDYSEVSTLKTLKPVEFAVSNKWYYLKASKTRI